MFRYKDRPSIAVGNIDDEDNIWHEIRWGVVCRLRDMGSAPLSVGYARISSRNQIKNYRGHLFLPSQYCCVLSVLVITGEYFYTTCATPKPPATT